MSSSDINDHFRVINRVLSDDGLRRFSHEDLHTVLQFLESTLKEYPELLFSSIDSVIASCEDGTKQPNMNIADHAECRNLSASCLGASKIETATANYHHSAENVPLVGHNITGRVEGSSKNKLLCWMIRHLLRVLTVPRFSMIQTEVHDLISLILTTASMVNHVVFAQLVAEIVLALHDLSSYCFKYCEPNITGFTATLNRLKDLNLNSVDINETSGGIQGAEKMHDRGSFNSAGNTSSSIDLPEDDLTSRSIDLPDANSCRQLQISLTTVLVEVSASVCLYADAIHSNLFSSVAQDSAVLSFSVTDILWSIICIQLECGEVSLKAISLRLAVHVLAGGLPSFDMLSAFVDLLLSLISLLASGFVDCESDYESLEACAADALTVIASELGIDEGETVSCVDRHLISQEYECELINVLAEHGTARLRTQKLRLAICCVLAQAMRCRISQTVASYKIHAGVDRLLQELISDDTRESRHLIAPLVVLISRDIVGLEIVITPDTDTSQSTGSDKRSDSILSNTVNHRNSALNRHAQTSKQECIVSNAELTMNVTEISIVAARVCGKLDEVVTSLKTADSREVLRNLQATKTLIEILSSVFNDPVFCTRQRRQSTSCANASNSTIIVFSPDLLSRLIAAWMMILGRTLTFVLNDQDVQIIVQCYGVIISCVRFLLASRHLRHINNDSLLEIVAILSIPWLSAEMTWLDLGLAGGAETKRLRNISAYLFERIAIDIVCECILLLSVVQRPIAVQWRIQALRRCSNDERKAVVATGVTATVYLLHTVGAHHVPRLIADLHGLLNNDSSAVVQEALGAAVGPLTCVLHHSTSLDEGIFTSHSLSPSSLCVLSDLHTHLKCNCQEKRVTQQNQQQPSSLLPHLQKSPCDNTTVDASLITPFMFLVQNGTPSVQLRVIEDFNRLFGHDAMRRNEDILTAVASLINSADPTVCTAFSHAVRYLVMPEVDSDAMKCNAIVERELKGSAGGRSVDRMGCIEMVVVDREANVIAKLVTAGEIGKVADGELLIATITMLISSILSPFSESVESVAHCQLTQVAAHRHLTTKQLFLQFRRQICKVMADFLYKFKSRDPGWDPEPMLERVASLFSYDDLTTFLRSVENLLLPHLIIMATPTASVLLKTLSHAMSDTNHMNAILRTISHTFCHVICSCPVSGGELERVQTFLESETCWPLAQLLRSGDHTDSMLLVHLSTNYEQVLKGLRIWLASRNLIDASSPATLSNEHLANQLQHNFLGTLFYFDRYLNDLAISHQDKVNAYRSLTLFLRLMGPAHVTRVRMRAMTTLKIGLRYRTRAPFAELCCEAWSCFVNLLETAALGPMLAQIVVSLLPLLLLVPEKVAEILYFLVVTNEDVLREYLHELYFLPNNIPELSTVNAKLRPYISGGTGGEHTQMTRLLKGIAHEAPDVRTVALTKMRQTLRDNRDALHDLILRSETADPLISQIVAALLQGCLESTDPATRILYGECLGELGAIDPGRLEELMTNRRRLPKEELGKFMSSIQEYRFAYELINELAKASVRSEDQVKDSVEFALQELIAIFEIKGDETGDGGGCTGSTGNFTTSSREEQRENKVGVSESSGARLWKSFTADVREIISPFMRSRYVMNFQLNWLGLVLPIYRSKKGHTFELWVCTLASYLGSKIADERCNRVYCAVRGVVRLDSQIALYVLPYLAVQMLLDGEAADHEMLYDEICAVLHHARETDTRNGSATSDRSHMCAQTVFSVLDHMTKWARHRLLIVSTTGARPSSGSIAATTSSGSADARKDPSYIKVKAFIDRVPQDVLARASYNCGAYTRALMHHELFMKPSQTSLSDPPRPNDLDFLLSLYASLDEPDGIAGITAIQTTSPSLAQQILALESVGQLSEAAACYDRAIQMSPDEVSFCQGMLRNCLALGELNSALHLANGMIADRPDWRDSLNAYRVEAAWKLGQWDKLEIYLHSEDSTSDWNVGLGRLLLASKSKDESSFNVNLTRLRHELMGPLSAACMEIGSYHRGYEYIVRLHMLSELENVLRKLFNFEQPMTYFGGATGRCGMGGSNRSLASVSSSAVLSSVVAGCRGDDISISLNTLIRQWQSRLEFTQPSYRTRAPILNLRRAVLHLVKQDQNGRTGTGVDLDIGQCWLESARVARECHLIHTAHSALLSAAEYSLPEYCTERSKWLWEKGESEQARKCLERALEDTYADHAKFKATSAADDADGGLARLACARVMLQLARYYEETASCESGVIMRQFKNVCEAHSKWEDGYFHTAKYYDKIMLAVSDGEIKRGSFVFQVVNHFGLSLTFGSQYIYQSMPRLLALWLDYGADVAACDFQPEPVRQAMRTALKSLNQLMSQFCTRLQPYQFFVAFPQLISRICHTQPDVFSQLKEIIANVLREFPQQAMWMMMAVSKSSYQVRVKRCQEIFTCAKNQNPSLNKFLIDAMKLTDRLIELCNKGSEGTSNTLRISTHFKPLQRLLEDKDFSRILIPLQAQMTPTLPSILITPSKHVPFPTDQVYIAGIEDVVEVLMSLQKPKKIQFRGTDGRTYNMLCKPKDDLRKDGRLMEFNDIVNRCLKLDAESRRRDLHIRTFTVTPLNEECGMLEWVANTAGLRPILLKLYKERGLYMTGQELKSCQLAPTAAIEKKLTIYRTRLLPRHPPVFSEWFLKTFPDPTSWYNARLVYCRSAAVMSMVGYVLGLGDRHGENILLDSTTGDCVHVDFNCLFNKGETFDFPEIVPFRLTHNMIEAMGPLGFEGIFRRSCEVTLRVMRDQSDSLMSVLKTFIFDPLVEWSKPVKGRSNPAETGEIRNEKAQTHVNNIEDRLRGVMKAKTKISLPLSVEGHVSHLIKEATSETNLCQMYIGWAAYM